MSNIRSPKSFIYLLFFTILLVFSGISKANPTIEEIEKQQLEEIKNQDSFSWDQIGGWHTQGIVSKDNSIQINFNRSVIDEASIGQSASRVMFITPPIKGEPKFITKSSIVWQPEESLKHGTEYKVTIKPVDLKDVPPNAAPFQFAFNVIPLEYQIKTFGLSSVNNKPEQMSLKGQLLVSDSISDEDAQSILSAKLENKSLIVEWLHESNGKEHNFIIRDITRDEFETSLVLDWNGDKLNIKSKGQKEIAVPSLKDFKITNIRVIDDSENDDPFVEVLFSDELDRKQNLNGLVKLAKNEANISIQNNGIYIYPKKNITGEFEVRLFKGIKANNDSCSFDICKKTLKEDVAVNVNFNDAKPQVKFVGKGTILPSNSILEIPFEAVGINAVEVTAFKIYPDNIGQFLQVNGISGDTEINRGGRYLWRKTIPLNPAEPNQWNRFSFDVTDLMKEHPGGLLRLTLSIKRRHSTFNCPGQNSPASQTEEQLKNWEDNGLTQASGWDGISDYYEEGQGNNYDWDERKNPCSDSYYTPQGENNILASQNFIASNIGLVTKQDAKGNLKVISTDLRTAKPLPGTEFEVRNFQGQVLSTGTSDGQGFADIKLTDTPFLLVAKKLEDTTYLKLNTKTALAVSHFDVGGETISKGIKGHIYGERGVWRPGDDIFLTFVLQNTSKDSTERLPEKHPVTMKLVDPQGRTVETKTSTDSVGGFYSFKFKTDEESQTGNWLVNAFVGGSSFSKPIMIETVRPNRLKIELSFDDGSDKDAEVLYSSDGRLEGKIFSQWLHGATAENLSTDIKVRFDSKKTKFTKFTEHEFDDPTRSLSSSNQELLDDRLDSEGYLTFDKDLSVDGNPPGMLRANFTTRVFEEGGAFSISRSSVDYHHYDNYVGIKLPKGDATRGMLLTDVTHTVDVASLSAKGENSSTDRIQMSLYKIHWKWWWDKSADSLAQYADSEHKQLLQQETISTNDGTGSWDFQIDYPEWGRYLVRACDSEGDHCSGKVVYIDWPGWAGRAQEEGSGAASRLNLFSDKPAYSVGEIATIQLPEAVQGRALLSVETGSQILEQRWVDFEKAEDKEGRESRVQFKFKVTEDMAPNVYVHMTLLQPHESKKNDRPIRLYGIIPLEVSNPKTYLKPRLEASDEWKPESKQIVKVSETNGREMNYTLAVVDEGLLGLTAFKTPNLHRNFYKKEALGIQTWDMFDDVVGAYGGNLERMLALGGGDENSDQDDSKKRRFPPVVKYLGPFNLKAGETAEHEIELPPYLGAVRVMIVAGEMNTNIAAYGKTDKSIFVRQPLMLQSSLPRVLGPDEEVAIPVSLFVMDENIKDVQLSVTTDELSSAVGDSVQNVSIEKVGDKTAFVKVKTGTKAGKASIKLTAVAGANGEHKSEKEVFLDIRRANQETTRTTNTVIEPNASWSNKLDAFGITGTNQAVIELSSVPSLNLKKRLDYLTRYPHGCLEQTTSAAFPQLFLSNVMDLTEKQTQETEHHVRRAIDRLQRFQKNSGDFNYWPGGNDANTNTWASIYAGHFLIEAKNLGYVIPSNMLNQWLNYQSRISQEYLDGSSRYSHVQAYRLYALARGGKPQLGAMNRLRESAKIGGEKSLNKKGRWLLASAYQAASQPAAAKELIQGMSLDVDHVSRTDRTFSSTLGDLGLRLENLVALDKKQDANLILEKIGILMGGDGYQNTQGIAWALLGVSRYLDGDTSSFSAKLSQNGTTTDINSKKSFNRTRLLKADSDISLQNTSKVPLFVNVVNTGVPTAGNEISQNNGLEMNVTYLAREAKDDWTELNEDATEWQALQGKDVSINVAIQNTSNRDVENIALTIPAAAGLEITHSLAEGEGAPTEYNYRDLRDDRVHYYFNLKKGEYKYFQLYANASYRGNYYQPAITAEAMYEGDVKATKKGLRLDIVSELGEKLTKEEALTLSKINEKSYLYDEPNKVTKMYLIEGDKVTINDTNIDDKGQKWYYINYKGKKELNMWLKAEAID